MASGHRRCCALAVHIGRLLYRSRHRAGRSFKSRRARCASMPFFGVRPPPLLCSRRPHRTFTSRLRSGHRAGRSFKSRRARCALTGLDALLWRQAAAAAVLSPSTLPHRTFTPLWPSCRAIVQVEMCSLRSRCSMPFFGVRPPPSLCALAVHIGRLLFAISSLSPLCRAIVLVAPSYPVQYRT